MWLNDPAKMDHENKSKKVVDKGSEKEYESEFNEFWKLYIKKLGKALAFEKYIALRKNGTLPPLEELLSTLRAQNEARYSHIDKKYIPLPETWISGARWEDDINDLKIKKNIKDKDSKIYDDKYNSDMFHKHGE